MVVVLYSILLHESTHQQKRLCRIQRCLPVVDEVTSSQSRDQTISLLLAVTADEEAGLLETQTPKITHQFSQQPVACLPAFCFLRCEPLTLSLSLAFTPLLSLSQQVISLSVSFSLNVSVCCGGLEASKTWILSSEKSKVVDDERRGVVTLDRQSC